MNLLFKCLFMCLAWVLFLFILYQTRLIIEQTIIELVLQELSRIYSQIQFTPYLRYSKLKARYSHNLVTTTF